MEFMFERDDTADDIESMPELLAEQLEERAVDRIESTTESDDTAFNSTLDSDSMPELLADRLEERVDNISESVDESDDDTAPTATDNHVMSDILAEVLLTTEALTTFMVEFIIIPVDIAEATFESVSSVDGAPPANDSTAVVMAFDRLLPSVLIISEIIESLATRDAVAIALALTNDSTPELLAEQLDANTVDRVEEIDDATLNHAVERDATSEPRVDTPAESALDNVESMDESDDVAVDDDNDATPELLAETLEAIALNLVLSIFTSEDTALDNAVDSDSTLEPRFDTSDKSAVDSVESASDIDDATVENAADSDAMSDIRVDGIDSVVDCMVKTDDTAVDIVADNDVISEILAEVLFSIDALATIIVEFIIIPADIAEATFESLSNPGDASPTTDITAVVTALTRLTPSVLIIFEIAESIATSDAVAANNEVDVDATSELLT